MGKPKSDQYADLARQVEAASLELRRRRQVHRYLEHGASVSWVDIQSRKDAIQYVILGISEVYDRNLACFAGDLRFAEQEETMKERAALTAYHFLEAEEHEEAISSIGGFWDELMQVDIAILYPAFL